MTRQLLRLLPGDRRPGAAGRSRTAARNCSPPPNGCSPNAVFSRCGWRTSAPRPESAAPRSTGTSPTRKRCWSNCWWGSAPDCWPVRRSRGRCAGRRGRAGRVVDFHLDFALGESDLIRIQDRDLGQLPEPAKRQVRKAPAAVRRDLGRCPSSSWTARTRRGRRAADGARRLRAAELDPVQRQARRSEIGRPRTTPGRGRSCGR